MRLKLAPAFGALSGQVGGRGGPEIGAMGEKPAYGKVSVPVWAQRMQCQDVRASGLLAEALEPESCSE